MSAAFLATAQLSRLMTSPRDIAESRNSHPLEIVSHRPGTDKALVGVDLKSTRSPTCRRSILRRRRSICSIPSTASRGLSGTVFADQTITQKQAGYTRRIQLKLGRFHARLSGRNDWVNTLDNNRLAPSISRDDSRFSGARVIYNTDLGIAPYVSLATSYTDHGTNFTTGQLSRPKPACRPRPASDRTSRFQRNFGAAVV